MVNVYVVWLLREILFLFFFLIVLGKERKRLGLIIYFFFQSVMSLFLFLRIFLVLNKSVFLLLTAKLGLFPFFYWIVVARVKVGFFGNIFILGLQKLSVFWLLWLFIFVNFRLVYFMIYLRIFFVVVRLVIISDLWLLLVYSSIANTGMIMIRVYGSSYFIIMVLYLAVVVGLILYIRISRSYIEVLLVVYLFLVVPPFLLFFIKYGIRFRIDFNLKLGLIVFIFDVLVLLYYFRFIFIKFLLMDLGFLIYGLNLFLVILILVLRNCVTMVIFY